MDNRQVNQHDRDLKVRSFLREPETIADTASIVEVAAKKTRLEDLISKVILADGQATVNTTGYTVDKKNKRKALEELTLKVCRGAKAYATASGNDGLKGKVSVTETSLRNLRDSDLDTFAQTTLLLCTPIAASLVPYTVTGTVMTAFSNAIDSYIAVINEPNNQTDDKKLARGRVERFQADIRDLLNDLDTFMDLFLGSNDELVAEYYLARAIDDLGGSPSAWIHNNTVAPSDSEVTPTFSVPSDTALRLENKGLTELSFQLMDSDGPIGTPILLAGGATYTGTLGSIGAGGDRFKVSNPDLGATGSFRIVVG